MAGVYSKERKRKLEDENRAFQAEWEGDFFFTKGKKEGTALCLICRETVHGNKRYNLNRHYTSIHSQFEEKFPKKFKIREEKLQSLKKSFACERSTLFNAMNKNELITKASYQVTEILAQKMKPFSDAEIVKECVVTVCKTLFSHLPNSKQILDEVSKLQLSDLTCMRRSQDLAANIALNITDELQQSKYFSLALDSSTDITSISQLLLFVKYVSKDCVVKENFLGMIPMTGQTRATKEKEYPDVYDFSWWLKVAFLTDTMCIMNETLTRLQGHYNNIVTKMISIVFSQEQKLNMYIEELSNSDYSSFPSVKTLFDENPDESQDVSDLIKLLTDLKNEMSLRFSDFRKYQEPFRLVENPWSITTANIAHLSVFGYEARDLKNELIDLQHDTELKSVFEEKKKNKAHYEFWKAVEKDKFPNLIDCTQKILYVFASTYVCESTFSKLKFIKNKYRSRLTSENVENILRISVPSQPANIDAILESCERFRHSTSTN
ncbi:hypothetical protein QTP88_020889 [Uroleucon formosanum]